MKLSDSKMIIVGAAMCWPMMINAQEITLRSDDGVINIEGTLLEYQDNTYTVSSELGTINVRGDKITCIGAACPDVQVLDQEVTFAGSETVAEGLLPVLLAGYAASMGAEAESSETIGSIETNVRFVEDQGFGDVIESFRVRSTVSSDSFMNLLGKSAEIGVSSRRILVEEARALRDAGSGSMISSANEYVLANDSIIIVTHPSNPVESISVEQLAQIYDGSIQNWSELGGNNAPISAIHLAPGSGTRGVFDDRILAGNPSQPAKLVEADGSIDVSRKIAEDENAIGYVSFAFKRGAQAMTLVSECGISMNANAFSAKTGEYLLQRPLYFYARGDTVTEEATAFLDWAQSKDAESSVSKAGFIDLGVSMVEQGPDTTRANDLRNAGHDAYESKFANEMIGRMANFDRLSSTFRVSVINRLTPQSRVDLGRLVDHLEVQPAGEYLLVGFTDDQGPFEANLGVSLDRAENIAERIREIAGGRIDHITFSTAGYGELAPVACNSSKNGRGINRRVEVWASKSNG